MHFQVLVQCPNVRSFLDPKPRLWAAHLLFPVFLRVFAPEKYYRYSQKILIYIYVYLLSNYLMSQIIYLL